jgi:hypothetical protein
VVRVPGLGGTVHQEFTRTSLIRVLVTWKF